MTDHPRPQHEPAEFDAEIGVRAIFGVLAGLALLVAVSFGAMFGLSAFLKSRSIARDPEPLPVAEANQPRPRPRAALQSDPAADMSKFAKEEQAALTSYAWVDRSAGVVRIPVDRAIDIVAERGLPVPPPLPAGAAPAAPATSPVTR
ncbi:MAG: hypothetical protein U0529_08110 [Thermoanaerobaculia bacterium]